MSRRAFAFYFAVLSAFTHAVLGDTDGNDKALKWIQSVSKGSEATAQDNELTEQQTIDWLNSHIEAYAFSANDESGNLRNDMGNGNLESQSISYDQSQFKIENGRLIFDSFANATWLTDGVTKRFKISPKEVKERARTETHIVEVEHIEIPLKSLNLSASFSNELGLAPTRSPSISRFVSGFVFTAPRRGLLLETLRAEIEVESHYYKCVISDVHRFVGREWQDDDSVQVVVDGNEVSEESWPRSLSDQDRYSRLLALHGTVTANKLSAVALPVYHNDEVESKKWAIGTFNAIKHLATLSGASPDPFMPAK